MERMRLKKPPSGLCLPVLPFEHCLYRVISASFGALKSVGFSKGLRNYRSPLFSLMAGDARLERATSGSGDLFL